MSREARKAATRIAILEASRQCFRARGFDASTIGAIAKEAGVSVGTVHLHFADKATLVAACFHGDIDVLLTAGWASRPEGPVLTQLLHFAEILYSWYAEDPELSRALVKESLFLKGPMAQPMAAQAFGFMQRLSGLIAQAVASGELAAHIPPEHAAEGFFGDYFTVLLGGLHVSFASVDEQLTALRVLTELRLGLYPSAPTREEEP